MACSVCGTEGYGAGPCCICQRLICYDHASDGEREGHVGRWWFCPECFDAKAIKSEEDGA